MTAPRRVGVLPAPDRERLERAPFTYPRVGATLRQGPPPAGYATRRATAVVGHGEADFRAAADAVLRWQLHRRAGLGVRAAAPVAAPGVVVELRLGVGPLALRIPCRVVATVDEPRRQGFAYGTLPGHPERGEEAFLVSWRPDGAVEAEIVVFSVPAWPLVRAVGPLAAGVQRLAVTRYLRALRPPRPAGDERGQPARRRAR